MKVLMVCLGNICRSPMAQGVLEQKLFERGLSWKVDSAGTNGYHDGESPDPRAIKCAATHGIAPDPPFSFVPDPYYDNSFERSYELINLACEALLTKYNGSVKELEV